MAAPSPIRSLPPKPPGSSPSWHKILAAVVAIAIAVIALLRLASPTSLDGASPLLFPPAGSWQADGLALLTPVALALLVALLLEWLPRRPWSRVMALVLLLLISLRYLLWRLTTLDPATPLALGVGSLMLAVEVLYLGIRGLSLAPAPLFDPWRRRRQADQLQHNAIARNLTVEFWVKVGEEDERIVRRALIACREVDHPHVQVAVLDRSGRPSVSAMATALGMRYVPLSAQRGETLFAAMLAVALPDCRSDVVALFECRFMPFANFLQRTLGFFQDERVAMVQTPLTFFRSEFYNRNLGADQVMPGERDLFFHYHEVVLDRFNSVQACAGSSVIRRQALEHMQDDPDRDSLRESTGVAALQRAGERVVYLDEILCIGEAPHTFAAFLDQQLEQRRDQMAIIGAGGTLPLGHPLSPWPLLHQIARSLALLTPLLRLAFLLLPLFALLMGFPLIRATLSDYLIYAVPLLVLLHTVPSWLTDHHDSRFWGEVSESLTAVPSLRLFLGKIRRLQDQPQGRRSPASSPETAETEGVMLQSINLNMAWPFLLILVELMAVLFLRYVLPLMPGFDNLLSPGYSGETLMLLWNLHNGWVMIVCLICAVDQPVRRQGDRIPIRRSGRLEFEGFSAGGISLDLSETGAAFLLNPGISPPPVEQGWLRLDDTPLHLPVRVVRRDLIEGSFRMGLRYEHLDATSTGALLRLLYGGAVELPQARRIGAIDAFRSLLGGIWGANPIVRRY